jgi:hypothetical protein
MVIQPTRNQSHQDRHARTAAPLASQTLLRRRASGSTHNIPTTGTPVAPQLNTDSNHDMISHLPELSHLSHYSSISLGSLSWRTHACPDPSIPRNDTPVLAIHATCICIFINHRKGTRYVRPLQYAQSSHTLSGYVIRNIHSSECYILLYSSTQP